MGLFMKLYNSCFFLFLSNDYLTVKEFKVPTIPSKNFFRIFRQMRHYIKYATTISTFFQIHHS